MKKHIACSGFFLTEPPSFSILEKRQQKPPNLRCQLKRVPTADISSLRTKSPLTFLERFGILLPESQYEVGYASSRI